MKNEFNDSNLLIRSYGIRRAQVIIQRLGQLSSAIVLEDIRNLSGAQCHELKQNRKGQLAVYLDHPYRLVFEPADDPIPFKADGCLDWSRTTSIRVLEVINYHD